MNETEIDQDLFVGEDDASIVVQCGLEGEAAQVVIVLEVDMVPLDHQSGTYKKEGHSHNHAKPYTFTVSQT